MSTLEEEVAGLTQATTDLLDAVNVKKSTLDASAATATAAAESATLDAVTATEQAGIATGAASVAEAARDVAVAVAYEGEASLTPSAGKIPLAGADGKIGNDWLRNFVPVPGAAEMTHYDAATDTGYFGTIEAGELINGPDLAALIGLTAGTAQHDNFGWFKFYVGPLARCNRTASIASGTITVSDTPVADETLTVGDVTFTFVASRSGAGEITIDADNAGQATNIRDAIRSDTALRARIIVHTPDINSAAPVGADPNVVIVTPSLAGVAGNSVALTASVTGIAVSGSGTLEGGADGTAYTLFVAQRPYRYSVSWNHINAAAAVSGATTIGINGRDYKIRLLTGGDADPATFTYGTACSDNPGENSEWNELMYRIHTDAPTCDDVTIGMPGGLSTTRHGGPQVGANWDTKTDSDIIVASGNGRYQWCQEVSGPETSRRVTRGLYGLAYFSTYVATGAGTLGWRPCLEVV